MHADFQPVAEIEVVCKSCGAAFAGKRYHAGFSDSGFLYCDKDSTILTWNAYDPDFDRIVEDRKMPWGLTREEMRRVEDHLIGCPCGGRFLFANPLRCPKCGQVLSGPMTSEIYEIIIGRQINGEEQRVWRDLE